MRNTRFERNFGTNLPREVQLQRLHRAVREELTPAQRDTLLAYYFEDRTMEEIARLRGVNRSTVWRTLKRAEKNLRRMLSY